MMAHVRPTLSRDRASRDALRRWLRETPPYNQATHFITLASNDPMMRVARARERLSEWDKRISKFLVGGRWHDRPLQRPSWIAFLEEAGNGPHWHMLFRISPKMKPARLQAARDGLGHEAATSWEGLVSTGTANVQGIYCIEGAIDYITKETDDLRYISEFVTEAELRSS